MENFLKRITVRSVVVVSLVFGAFWLAVTDPTFRPAFGDLAKVAIGGYLGQMLPQSKEP